VPAIGGSPRQPNSVADDTVAVLPVACRVDQFPFVDEVNGCQDREPALIEADRARQAFPALEGRCQRFDIDDV
jgi:hypothetical protein